MNWVLISGKDLTGRIQGMLFTRNSLLHCRFSPISLIQSTGGKQAAIQRAESHSQTREPPQEA
jgi:hypothetical protein